MVVTTCTTTTPYPSIFDQITCSILWPSQSSQSVMSRSRSPTPCARSPRHRLRARQSNAGARPSSVATVMRNVCHLDGKSDRSLGESECYQSVYMYMLKCTCQVESQVTSDVCDSRLNTSTIKRKKRDCRFVNVIPEAEARAGSTSRHTQDCTSRAGGRYTRGVQGRKGKGGARGVAAAEKARYSLIDLFNLQLHACEMTRLVLLLAGVRSRPLRRWTVM